MTAATNVSRLPVRTDTLYALTQAFHSVLGSLESDDTSVEDVAAELGAIAGTIQDAIAPEPEPEPVCGCHCHQSVYCPECGAPNGEVTV